jgi:hypothetical protein
MTAAEIVDLALQKPELVIHGGNLPATAEALRDLLAASGRLFDRGLPVRIVRPADGGPPSAMPLTKHNVVIEAHRLCQPMKVNSKGEYVRVTLLDRVALMYLDMSCEWALPPLAGVTTAPLLSGDGGVRSADGYDSSTKLVGKEIAGSAHISASAPGGTAPPSRSSGIGPMGLTGPKSSALLGSSVL